MKLTLSWLKEHLDTDAGLDEIVAALPALGLDVDSVIDRGESLKGFIVAKVREAKPHPDADRLSVCQVDTGSGTVEVVCGAPNARTGLIGVFAPSGSYIPGTGITLKETKIRGITSNGMLLSEREMGLSDDHDRIIELADDTPIGASAIEVMGLDDPVIDIEITPNRADCLGVRGIARDLAAKGIGTLKPLNAEPVKGTFESPIRVRLDFGADSPSPCPYFIGRTIRGVKNGESPQWLKDRLNAIGLRPISALVDITNLMAFGHCRPMHVFDADSIRGDLHVRLARAGEKLTALDGETHTLDPSMTVIADDHAVESLAGVIGGARTGCTEKTVDVFVESAYFDPIRTAETGRRLNVMSDARYRFERGVDPAMVRGGMEIATRLILEICGGEASDLVIAGDEPAWQRTVAFRPDRLRTLGGVTLSADTAKAILALLGFSVEDTGTAWQVSVPSWRGDIVGEADLVEEILRVNGYDNIPAVSLPRIDSVPQPALDSLQVRRKTARRALAARGLYEAVTYSFMSSNAVGLFGGAADAMHLANPISSDLDVMRPSILPNLIAAAGRNADRGYGDGALFEVGPQYAGAAPEDQRMVAAGIRAGQTGPRHWANPPRPCDVYDAKADALAVLDVLGAPVANVQIAASAPGWYHPGRSGALTLGPKTVLAYFGEIHPRVLMAMGVKGPVAGFEILLDHLPLPKVRKGPARPALELSAFQPVERDFAFVVDEHVEAAALMRAAAAADKALIVCVDVFDVFAGGNIGAGKKSIALSVTLQPRDKTLTEAEIDAVAGRIIGGVGKATGAVLRT